MSVPVPVPALVAGRLARARMELLLGHPFFGAMVLRLTLREDPDCRDLWTDGQTLGYNPETLAGRGEELLAAMLAHEILHLACEHHLRRGDRDKVLWNKACDLAINGLLAEAGFTLPREYPVDPAQAGRPAEAIYAALAAAREERPGSGGKDRAKQKSRSADAAPGGGEGQNPFAGKAREPEAGPTEDAPSGRKKERQAAAGDKDTPDGATRGAKTTIAGEVRDHPDLDGEPGEAARRTLAARVRQDVSQALRAAADMGDLPASLARHLRDLARPRLPWATLLRRFILARAVSDYAWSPPSRRHVHLGLYLPTVRSPALGDVVLAIDTSGSVDEGLLRAFCEELSGILDACDARLFVYACDAAASEATVHTRHDPPPSLLLRGGGGTDYRPVFSKVEQDGLAPACLIYLTDLECDRYPDEPAYPVLWAAPESANGRPPFGETLTLSR